MKPTLFDPKSPRLPKDSGYHPSHAEISSVEGDALKRARLPVHGESKPLGRKPRHNRISGEVRTEHLV